ncbi:MAG: dihydropteroate synthase [Polyangiaceae bacterium]
MGIVNRTPDSFFDGGSFLADSAAREHVSRLVADGADIIDVGAESTRPGAPKIDASEQIDRIGEAIAWVVAAGARASVDTTAPDVAAFALEAGATMVNSVALGPAAALAEITARHPEAELVLTHCRGDMTEMAGFSRYADDAYQDVVGEVAEEWCRARAGAVAAGLAPERILFDPGLGFAKNAAQSLELCGRLPELKARIGPHRVLVGPSRKSYVAHVTTAAGAPLPPASQRLGGTIAATLDCVDRGADIVRVHDVAAVAQALAYRDAVSAWDQPSDTRRAAGGRHHA